MTLARSLLFLIAVMVASGQGGVLLADQPSSGGILHTPRPTPTPAPPPAPTGLRFVSKASECAHHGGSAAESACRTALWNGRLVLVFEWTGTERYHAADRFNVYEIDHGQRTLVDQTTSHATVGIVKQHLEYGSPQQCYAVSALVGKLESPLSTKYCGPALSYVWQYKGAEHCATQFRVTYSWVDAASDTNWYLSVYDLPFSKIVDYHHNVRGALPTTSVVIAVPMGIPSPLAIVGGIVYYFHPPDKRGGFNINTAGAAGFKAVQNRPCRPATK